jgi:predicted enzyme related to lactoylglutathione lyase
MDSVVHFEIPAKDTKRASTFYTKAFGWQISQFPGFEYWSLGTTPVGKDQMPTNAGAINAWGAPATYGAEVAVHFD